MLRVVRIEYGVLYYYFIVMLYFISWSVPYTLNINHGRVET